MSGKAATPPAPRLLVYVAERQLDPSEHAPGPPPAPDPPDPSTFYKPNFHNGIYQYKHVNTNSEMCSGYGANENTIAPRADFYSMERQFREQNPKVGDNADGALNLRRDSNLNAIGMTPETFQESIPTEAELSSHQMQCMPVNNEHIQMHTVFGQNRVNCEMNLENVHSTENTEQDSDIEKEPQSFNGGVNYQFLEQSMTHQSILNQSISILNQQVAASRYQVGSEGSGPGRVDSAPQLVRTADGMVLAVLPQAQPSPQRVEQSSEVSSRSVRTIIVPLGWRRIVSGSSVLYISPSGTALNALPQLRDYLQTPGTCKCGLQCPLWPEAAFSFDPKVASKPYQMPIGSELTKLCNHKRKLLATLQQRQPGTPPPTSTFNHQPEGQRKGSGPEASVLKKKTKKKSMASSLVPVPNVIPQRERYPADFKITPQDQRDMAIHDQNQTPSPISNPIQNHYMAANQDINEIHRPEYQEQKYISGSHYLTVNSGCINQPPTVSQLRHQQTYSNNMTGPVIPPGTSPLAMGQPVRGTNGQIIGVHTGGKPEMGYRNAQALNQQINIKEEERKTPQDQNTQLMRIKEEDVGMFCGENQPPLTPEVMQKINQQQQIFIQQNQKQIELAMKCFRTQIVNEPQNLKSQQQIQGQLVVQNGTVINSNPGKTPPWQVKKSEPNQGQRIQTLEANAEDGNVEQNSNNRNATNQEQNINQMLYPSLSRVPPLPQHYPMMQQWPNAEQNKKKSKASPKSNKKKGIVESKSFMYGNHGMRSIQENKIKSPDDVTNNGPSFMDDPNGYLAQQTALLNNTISRQVDPTNFANSGVTIQQHEKAYRQIKNESSRGNISQNSSPMHNHIPDSSVLTENNGTSPCCRGCPPHNNMNAEKSVDTQRRSYIKSLVYQNSSRIDTEPHSMSSPKHTLDDNPVTSSTFEKGHINAQVCDSRGPIQGGTVSTSMSPIETMQLPEPSPTPSNSSRNTDTPQSNNSSVNISSSCPFTMPSPAYSNPGSCRENYISNPSTPTPNSQSYNSPGTPTPQNIQTLTGAQMMNFISNHNVNKNLMEVDNISFAGVNPVLKSAAPELQFKNENNVRRFENMTPFCAPPHLGGGPSTSFVHSSYVQNLVTTMAPGFSVIRDTITSVLAGKANTATTSINASTANFVRPPPPVANSYAIPPNHPDPFINSVNLPTSYPLHIAGTVAQNMISKTPLEMVQNVVSNIPLSRHDTRTNPPAISQHSGKINCQSLPPGQILISSTGQIIVPSQSGNMPPPAAKSQKYTSHQSSVVTNVTSSVAQVIPAVGGVQQVVTQPTVLVNTLPGQFMLPQMMTVDGQVVPQNTVLPQMMSGMAGHSNENGHGEIRTGFTQRLTMLSPESLKKKGKKRKGQPSNLTNVLHIAAPQSSGGIMVQHASPPQHSSQQFSPRGFQLSPNNNISPGPMLQALTIVPGKQGTPAHIVMNGQGAPSNYGSQQIITNTSPTQQINLLQPVNLINNGSGVVPNFPTFQQFILPNLGGMVMTADGTAIIQDNSTGMPVQLQIQTVNGQSVLTPVQNQGVVLRAQNSGKIIQSQHSPGAQFLSPNSHIMMNSPTFNGQLSPLIANLSPTNVSFNTSPPQMRSAQPQELIQVGNQMGQTLMVPLSPKAVAITSNANIRGNSTFVQQNTTIVQQQTTLVSNPASNNIQNSVQQNSRLSIDPNVLFNNVHKKIASQVKSRNISIENHSENTNQMVNKPVHRNALFTENEQENEAKSENVQNPYHFNSNEGFNSLLMNHQLPFNHLRHSVSTQTLVNQQQNSKSPPVSTYNQQVSGSSPPDTTTHSPLGPLETSSSPRMYSSRSVSIQGNYADTTTRSPEPNDVNTSAMVQCVSSSEPDIADIKDQNPWPINNDFITESDGQGIMSPNMQVMATNNIYCGVESSDNQFNQTITVTSVNNQQNITITPPNYFERTQNNKRKNEFGDGDFRAEKIMRGYHMHGISKEIDYDERIPPERTKMRHCTPSVSHRVEDMQKIYERRNLSSNETENAEDATVELNDSIDTSKPKQFRKGELVWGPAKGYPSWPGKLVSKDGNQWMVKWFGGEKQSCLVAEDRLQTLTEGLEAHHAARTKCRKSRKLNSNLEKAIQEAMSELDKMSDNPKKTCEVDSSQITVIETPKKHKREGKSKRSKSQDKLNKLVKIAPNPAVKETSGRLRSSR